MQLWKHPLLALADLEPDPLKPRFSGHDISRLQNTSSLSRIGDGEKLRNSWWSSLLAIACSHCRASPQLTPSARLKPHRRTWKPIPCALC